jgi:hypothetical protein
MMPVGQRFLVIYAGVLTVVFAVTVFGGFVRSTKTMSLDQLDVKRINVRESDGTLRLAISGADKAPGIIIKGKEYPHPNRKAAGMIFYNDEGTENGGLTFGGEKAGNGTKGSHGHLSFDAYEQDQTMALDSHQEGTTSYTALQFSDRPDHSIMEEVQLMSSIKGLPQDQQQARIKAFVDQRGGPTTRMLLGRGPDSSVQLVLADAQGRQRIVMKVAPDGAPSLQMLDSAGKVIGEMVSNH